MLSLSYSYRMLSNFHVFFISKWWKGILDEGTCAQNQRRLNKQQMVYMLKPDMYIIIYSFFCNLYESLSWDQLHDLLEVQSQSQKLLFRKEINIEHQNILTAVHDKDWSVNLPSGSRQGRLLLEPFNINYTVIWKSFQNTSNWSL